MKKIIFALIAMATISLASCTGNATNQVATEENAETIVDTLSDNEREGDTIVFVGNAEQSEVATEDTTLN